MVRVLCKRVTRSDPFALCCSFFSILKNNFHTFTGFREFKLEDVDSEAFKLSEIESPSWSEYFHAQQDSDSSCSELFHRTSRSCPHSFPRPKRARSIIDESMDADNSSLGFPTGVSTRCSTRGSAHGSTRGSAYGSTRSSARSSIRNSFSPHPHEPKNSRTSSSSSCRSRAKDIVRSCRPGCTKNHKHEVSQSDVEDRLKALNDRLRLQRPKTPQKVAQYCLLHSFACVSFGWGVMCLFCSFVVKRPSE